MKPSAIVLLVVLPTVPGSYAADCVTSFDASCLSREYKTEEIEAEQERRAKELEEFHPAAEKLEAREAEEETRRQAEAIAEERANPPPLTERELSYIMRGKPGDVYLYLPRRDPTMNVRIVP
jgi:hypothetical protein